MVRDAVWLAGGEAREIKCDGLCGSDRTLGIGAGQMSRVDASRIAVWKAGEAKIVAEGQRGLQRRVFPVPGRFGCGGGSGCDRSDSTGRFSARRGGG